MFGTYPQYAWMPTSSAIVIWAQGKLWRVETPHPRPGEGVRPQSARFPSPRASSRRSPSRCASSTEVAPDRFPVRMLARRDGFAATARRVVYSALGRIYVKRSADRRAAAPHLGHRASSSIPPFSPDGRSIVFTTWTDAAKGRVRVATSTGRTRAISSPRRATTSSRRSRLTAPTSSIARRSGDGIRGDTLRRAHRHLPRVDGAGLDTASRARGRQRARVRSHRRAHLLPRPSREPAVLASVDPRQRRRDRPRPLRERNRDRAVARRPWLAFTERWRAYVASFPHTGRPIDLAPKGSTFPVAQISRDSGWSLHWSDATHVRWTLGPELFTRDLTHTFPFVAQGLEKPDEPESKGVADWLHRDQRQAERPRRVRRRTDHHDGRACRCGVGHRQRRPRRRRQPHRRRRPGGLGHDSRRMRSASTWRGRPSSPGLIDAHAHVGGESSGILAETSWPLAANLAFGVTTLHDPSNDTETIFTNSEMIRGGLKLGPRLFSTGTILYGAETPFKAVIDSYDDALIAPAADEGRRRLQREELQPAAPRRAADDPQGRARAEDAGRARGRVAALSRRDDDHDGHTGIEHNLPPAPIYKDVITLFAKSGSATRRR